MIGFGIFWKGNSTSKAATSTKKRGAKMVIQLKALEDLETEPLIDGGKAYQSQIRYIIDFGHSILSSENLSGYTITLYNSSNVSLSSQTCGSDGYFEFDVYKNLSYFIISKGGISNRINIKMSQIRGILNFYLSFA